MTVTSFQLRVRRGDHKISVTPVTLQVANVGKWCEVQANWCFAILQEIYLKTTVEMTTLLHLEGFVMELL